MAAEHLPAHLRLQALRGFSSESRGLQVVLGWGTLACNYALFMCVRVCVCAQTGVSEG